MSSNHKKSDIRGWDEASYVISSSYRVAILEQLVEGPLTPSQLAENTDVRLAHVSRSIRQLRKRGMVELLVSEEQTKGRVYGVTEGGERIWSLIESQGLQ